MVSTSSGTVSWARSRPLLYTVAILLALVAFCAVFIVVGDAYVNSVSIRFPSVGTSAWLATVWGVLSRAYLLILIVPFILWRPRLLGFHIGKTWQNRRLLLVMLIANCGIIAAYLALTGSTTPYSGNQWLITEVITVPLFEEIVWRGIVFTALLVALRRVYAESTSMRLAVWFSGLAFGLLHANNALFGVPLLFVAIQTLNASVWGVMYGYARAKTGSIYPPMILHAAMNLVVILF
jgi:uncharacterized protein